MKDKSINKNKNTTKKIKFTLTKNDESKRNRKKNFKKNPPKKERKSRGITFMQLFFQNKINNPENIDDINNTNIIKKNLIKNKSLTNKNKSRVKNVHKRNEKGRLTQSTIGKKTKDKLKELNAEFNQNIVVNKLNTLNDYDFLDDYEINNLIFEEALKLDKRTFIQIYFCMLRKKHILISIFCNTDDNNLTILKFSRFVFLLGTNFSMSVLFFFDESMHKIYINSQGFNFIQQIPQIVYSSLISTFIEFLISYLILSESEINQLKEKKQIKDENYSLKVNKTIKCLKTKFIIYFIICFLLSVFYWYFVASFCAVYENTQLIFIEDSTTSFALSLIYPLFQNILFALCRIIPLKWKKNSNFCKLLYKLGVF